MNKKVFAGVFIGVIALTMAVLAIFKIEVPLKFSLPFVIVGLGVLIWYGFFRKG